jgi:hypothetical protein
MARIPIDDRVLELDEGRTVGYVTWGDLAGTPVFIGHGTPANSPKILEDLHALFVPQHPEAPPGRTTRSRVAESARRVC